MTTVVPGQYIVPAYKSHEGEAGAEIHRFIPGKGAAISTISAPTQNIPVVVATVLGRQVIQEIHEPEEEQKDASEEPAEATPEAKESKEHRRTFLVSVVTGNSYTEYAKEIESTALEAIVATATNLPREGDAVLVRITRLNPKQAYAEVLCVEGHGNVASDGGVGATGSGAHLSVPAGGGLQLLSLYGAVASAQGTMLGAQPLDIGETFKGVIRSQDVRSTDRDRVKIGECFKPGDIVRAVVLSLGDGSNYYLTTARNDLGVVFAKSEGGAGDLMVAIDWETMVCERTGVVEKRKCAKVL